MTPENMAFEQLNQVAQAAGLPPLQRSIHDEAALHGIPPMILEGLKRYIDQRVPTGDFLYAVLTNNLREAVFRADLHSELSLSKIVRWLHWEAPSQCWGSVEKVGAWLKDHQEAA